MPGIRAVAFVKRLATMSLQLEHQDTLATLHQMKAVMRVSLLLVCINLIGVALFWYHIAFY